MGQVVVADVDGNVLETFRADGGGGFIADIEVLRGDLSQVLHDDTRDGFEYVFGDRIAELAQDADGVDVAFAGAVRSVHVYAPTTLPCSVPGPHSGGLRRGAHLVWLTEASLRLRAENAWPDDPIAT